ncbi:MAG: heparinase II/III domain-containing protein [Gemmatimonadaceae bacterium]
MAHRPVTLLADATALDRRRAVIAGPLAPLAGSLRDELTPLLERDVELPREKALLSRDGGRCERDGTQLRFDPYSPREHRCGRCGAVFRRERDYLWWVTSYQLWLAERAVYAATLHGLNGEATVGDLAARILEAYAERYLEYPNRDNALGPTRPFFSTYLESIWLLQIAVALSLLEARSGASALGARVRERVLEPSARLIASFDEGDSNRQVWNAAALLAAGRLLGDSELVDQSIDGGSGILAHLARGLLRDGSWYEGENYHIFAHRGLWYGVMLAERAGCTLPPALIGRFEEGFAAPLVTALPDLTVPSRRDSQYAISLRQWRFAESFELGVARRDDPRLLAALARLYDDDVPRDDPGRWRSAADTQPHEPPSALARSDLGWRALLFARPALPRAATATPRSVLLDQQGLAIFRRDSGRVYAALDYGHSGGGHGHPDRLNVLLARGSDRILDDYGTGSYVDPTLHWYRSTLAHNAPLFDGVSQHRATGQLLAHEERGAAGWIDAEVPLDGVAPGVRVRRSLVVMPDYLVDRLEWKGPRPVRCELPIHLDAIVDLRPFEPAALDGGPAAEDGFSFVHDADHARIPDGAMVHVRHRTIDSVEGWVTSSGPAEWWRAVAPGPPGTPERSMALVRVRDAAGSITSVWSWAGGLSAVATRDGLLIIHRGAGERHEHARTDAGWSVTLHTGNARSSIDLGGIRRSEPAPGPPAAQPPRTSSDQRQSLRLAPGEALGFSLGAAAYRRSEESWAEAGSPRATVELAVTRESLHIDVQVAKRDVVFRPADAPDPMLDNETPDIHSDGVQLYLVGQGWNRPAAWLAVPERPHPAVRVRSVDGARTGVPLVATWNPANEGYAMHFEIPLEVLGTAPDIPIAFDLIVNEMSPSRARRRGQLVLSGGGGWIYLQGDRQSPSRFLPLRITRV